MNSSRFGALALLALAACSGEPSGPGTKTLAFTVQPANTVATGYFSVTVAIRDASGHVVTDATDSVLLAISTNPGAGTLQGKTPTKIAAVNGIAAFDSMQIIRAGTGYKLKASGTDLSSATSAAFNITHDVPVGLGFLVQPASTPIGTNIPAVYVSIQDAVGNTVANDTAVVSLALSAGNGATLTGQSTATTLNGVASFATLAVSRAGSGYTLLATAPGLNPASSHAFDITVPFRSVSAGDRFTCGVASTGAAYCWGENAVGQLGIGTTNADQPRPFAVAGGLKFSIVSAGESHSCGVTTASAAYCWGSDSAGALGGGGGGGGMDSTPAPVSGGLAFISLSATGVAFSCGVTTSNAGYCWGDNSAGQLGDSSTTASATPVPVSGGLLFARGSIGGSSACGVTRAGAGYCWGDNSAGALGTGTTTASTIPIPVSGGLTFGLISTRNGHSCGLTTAGQAYCWGANPHGELGDSNATGPEQCTVGGTSIPCSSIPVPVSGGLQFSALTTGWFHTCALTRGGAAWCWGSNAQGQLGDAAVTDSSLVPVPVSGGLTFIAISAGSLHTCGLTSSGVVYCWGSGASGELGNGQDGAGYFSNVPVAATP